MTVRVLIGFADALAAIESAWSLDDDGFEVYAFERRGTRSALARSSVVKIVSISAPELDAQRSADDLTAIIKDVDPAAILPLDDFAIWLCDRATALRPFGSGHNDGSAAALAGPVGRLATLALDKRLQLQHAEAAGFAVPASSDGTGNEPAGDGPWMVKPALAVELHEGRLRRSNGKVASDYGQLREVVSAVSGPVVVQRLLDGVGEGVFGLSTACGVTALSAHQRIRMMNPRGSGSSACRSIPVSPELVGPALNFIASTGWRGLFMIELLRDERGTPWFMELNGRPWGSMALACRRGLAYPAWAVRNSLDSGFVPTEPVGMPHLTARHLGREIVHLGAVMTHGGAPRAATIGNVLKFRRGDCWYNWRPDQPGVFASDTLATMRSQLRRKRSG